MTYSAKKVEAIEIGPACANDGTVLAESESRLLSISLKIASLVLC